MAPEDNVGRFLEQAHPHVHLTAHGWGFPTGVKPSAPSLVPLLRRDLCGFVLRDGDASSLRGVPSGVSIFSLVLARSHWKRWVERGPSSHP